MFVPQCSAEMKYYFSNYVERSKSYVSLDSLLGTARSQDRERSETVRCETDTVDTGL